MNILLYVEDVEEEEKKRSRHDMYGHAIILQRKQITHKRQGAGTNTKLHGKKNLQVEQNG